MRMMLFVILLFAPTLFAEEKPVEKKGTPALPSSTVTVKDAKKICKDKGKEGADRLKCIKEQTGAEQ